jgi:hypothetical protein
MIQQTGLGYPDDGAWSILGSELTFDDWFVEAGDESGCWSTAQLGPAVVLGRVTVIRCKMPSYSASKSERERTRG